MKGFTLLEVLIALVILASLSALTATSIQRSLKMKTRIQGDIDRDSQLRNAYRLIERDLNSAFHYRNISQELQDELAKATPIAGAPPTPPPATDIAGSVAPPPRQLTQFIGDEESVHFTSLNHVRMM